MKRHSRKEEDRAFTSVTARLLTKSLRQLGRTKNWLALESKVTPSMIGRILGGKTIISLPLFVRICRALDLDPALVLFKLFNGGSFVIKHIQT